MDPKPPQRGTSHPMREKSDLPAIAGGEPVRSRENRIIFGAPLIGEAEVAAVAECIRSGWIGLGERVGRFEQEFAAYKQAPYAAAVSSCSAGLHLVLDALGIGLGDEVIAPTLTFCSTIHAILHTGAAPVLVDSDRGSMNIDPALVERAITPRTKAVMVVHMCGRSCEMEAILEIAGRRNLKVVEDCAHAIETTYRSRAAGLLGDAGCFSFYPTKSITTGDGGMVISRHRELIERVKLLSYNGVATSAWTRFAGDVAGYEVLAAGYKYNMTDIEAALGLPQLPLLEERWVQRERLWRAYDERLRGSPVLLPEAGDRQNRHAYHLYTPLLQLKTLSVGREQIVAAMEAENIGVGIHYEPVHVQPFYIERFGKHDGEFPNATFIGERTISLPLSAGMAESDVAHVCVALGRILRYYAA
ncbi:MAG TPA: DegT/DnrJ/EryC1/StrS family aminotransferase [Candidatus Sulfotelmatobacter sp.]|nr:DegT/DnrJ/EryC1/StrS family aminotransferase [Candidatus Sulfotelmatobacter sp.]